MKQIKLLILGCGPAGLFAAQAAVHENASVALVSRKRPSQLFGAQYLHEPIPGLTNEPPVTVEYRLDGSPDEYRKKVYGEQRVTVSPESLPERHQAWDIRHTYEYAYAAFESQIQDYQIRGGDDLQAAIDVLKPDMVINSIPRPLICIEEDHTFGSQEIWAQGDAPELDKWSIARPPLNTVLCNGETSPGWYRASNVFGYCTTEWSGDKKPPFEGVAQVTKPIKTTCDCLPNVNHVGRYGRWTKGVLSHEAYAETRKLIQEIK